MDFYHFTEIPYPHLDLDALESVKVDLPNSYYDPAKGADLYHARFDEWQMCDELGIHMMVNEHHQMATSVTPTISQTAAILARQTQNVRILELGNPIANRRDPVRVAEETAFVDVVSRGRLQCGFVRGVPMEIAPSNINPTQSQSRFWEAHDLIKKAWTTHDGPFRWEGKHFHYRAVNIWPRPYQQPHPPIWITTSTNRSAQEIGRHGYVCANFLQGSAKAREIFDAYRQGYRDEHGTEAPADRFAFAGFSYVGETDEQAREGARKLLWYMESTKQRMQWVTPPGFVPPEAVVANATFGGFAALHKVDLDHHIAVGNMFCGSPDTVERQIREFEEKVGGVGHMLLMGHAGHMDTADVESHLKLLAAEVMPRFETAGEAVTASTV